MPAMVPRIMETTKKYTVIPSSNAPIKAWVEGVAMEAEAIAQLQGLAPHCPL